MSNHATISHEYSPYRRFIGWSILLFVSVGSLYLLVSVGVTLYRRRHVAQNGTKVSETASLDEVESCQTELTELTAALGKHLESFPRLLDSYDAGEAQQWAEQGDLWRNEWASLGKHCRFDEARGGKLSKELESMATAHEELGETEAIYAQELRRFGVEQAPRLDRIRARLDRISKRLDKARAQGRENL